jgi:S-adenosylmethionine-diacylglycerol 3-amino-3-carboxypropyl transferase
VDLSPAQLAALELRVAAYRTLSHEELLELMGSRPSVRRVVLFGRCRSLLSADACRFWDGQLDRVAKGIGSAGKFERYLSLFRQWVLPLVHPRANSMKLLGAVSREDRARFYNDCWNTLPWRALFRGFFSQRVLGMLGRDPSFFRYADQNVAEHLLQRVRYALTVLDPSANPYMHWILTGTHGAALPHALRPENFELIRDRLDRLEWHRSPIEDLLASRALPTIDRMNLSNVFEYIAADRFRALLGRLAGAARRGARLVYWNMIVPRRGADVAPEHVRELTAASRDLFARDKVFFYSTLRVEEVL